MKRNRVIHAGAAAALAAGFAIGQAAPAAEGQSDQGEGTEIGTVDYRVSCDDTVQAAFDHALGLMHHMMYQQARALFEEIARTDPDCAMAHWGIATTLFQPLWPERPSEDALKRGWDEIQQARELGAGAERERLLVEATAAFFRDPATATYWDRISGWAEGMAQAFEAQPDDLDTAALYSLSRLALAAAGAEERAALHDEAETTLRAVWEAEPAHPGAIHYSIHATDVDGRAGNALDMVEVYSEIAPEVPHALHMPSHIYVRLGDWPKVIEWNRRSADAALREPVDGAVSLHYIHGMDYLLYAYLQQGEDDQAVAIWEEARAQDRHQPSFAAAFHAAAMPARLAVEQRDWEQAMALEPRQPDYLPWDNALWAEALTWYARGLGSVHTGELESARQAEERLKALRDQAEAAGEEVFATYIDVDRRILSGWIAHAGGDAGKAIDLMQSAAELEDSVEKHPITPGALLPPFEALGDLYMALDRPGDALAAYRRSDETWPGRFNTLAGAALAAHAAGEDGAAQSYYARLLEVAGDSERATLSKASMFLE